MGGVLNLHYLMPGGYWLNAEACGLPIQRGFLLYSLDLLGGC